MEKRNLKPLPRTKKPTTTILWRKAWRRELSCAAPRSNLCGRGRVNLKDAWCSVVNGEILINGMHISPYEQGNLFNRDPLRVRRLLMHRREIMRLYGLGASAGLFPDSSLSSILRGPGSRCRSACARAQKALRRVRTWPPAPPSGTWSAQSRNGITDFGFLVLPLFPLFTGFRPAFCSAL